MSQNKFDLPFRFSRRQILQNILCVAFALTFFVFIFSSQLAFAAAPVNGQSPPSYVLVKTDVSSRNLRAGIIAYRWVASNKTSKDGKFFILEDVPSHYEIQSIVGNTPHVSTAKLNPPLPLSGPGPLTIGPFPIAANSSVTFNVTGLIHGNPNKAASHSIDGEIFSLLSESQLAGKKQQSPAADSLVERLETPTPTASSVSSGSLIQSVVAWPNISRGNQPVNFSFNLTSPARVNLFLFTIAGERVFDTESQENQGPTTLVWNAQNNAHQPVASGLYFYLLRAAGAGTAETRTGKILIIN